MAANTYLAVVDDDLSVWKSLSRLLRLAQFEPVSYQSARDFLADHDHPPFDCLVLDVRMEGMSGIELLARLAAEAMHPPVIFISALNDPVARAQAEALGCAGFFSKSTPGTDIIAAIRRATGDAQQHHRP